MPGGDRTGPLGEGAITGRKFGHCGDFGKGRRKNFGRRLEEIKNRLTQL